MHAADKQSARQALCKLTDHAEMLRMRKTACSSSEKYGKRLGRPLLETNYMNCTIAGSTELTLHALG